MCGRLYINHEREELEHIFGSIRPAGELEDLVAPRFNVAPSELLPAVRVREGLAEWALLKWGLIPSWAKDPAIANKLKNARSETIDTTGSYRAAYKARRCLIPISGFYEWKDTGAKVKQPYVIRMKGGQPFTVAGLWESWRQPDGSRLDTCTIVTTAPNDLMAAIHDRMPVIVSAAERGLWLHERDPDIVRHVMRPYDPDEMEAYTTSTYVSNSRNKGPECIEPWLP